MKTYIIGLFIVTAMLFTACNSNQKTGNQKEEKHEHVDGDGHDHANEKDHNHSEGDGHDHSNDKVHKHTDGDGHDHANEKDHQHSEGDGHDHGAEATEDSHTDEILFTRQQAQLVDLKTETIAPGSFYNSIKTSGQIQASQGDEAVIAATSNGIVSFTNPSITDGTPVKAGQSIVTISAKKLLEGDPSVRARIEFETAEKEFLRAESLVKDQIISAKDFEQARLRYETAKTAYQAQAGNMTAAGVSVTAPIAGYIKNRLVAQGEYVSVGQPIATVSQNRRLQLRAEVSENNFRILKSISSANFKPAYDNQVYKLSDLNGRLLSFGKASTDQSFYIPVTFEFDNVGDIIPGAYTEVYLLSTLQENVISVPISAITEEQGLNFVYLQIGAEEYKKQEVTVGQNNGERVQILSGLQRGNKVVTKGVYQVKLAATSSVMPEGHSH